MSRILYVHTGGVNTPERSATPIYLATTAAAMDVEVGIYFTVNGPQLLKKGTAESLIVPKHDGTGAPLRRFIDQAIDMGVKFYVCQPSLDLHGQTAEEIQVPLSLVVIKNAALTARRQNRQYG